MQTNEVEITQEEALQLRETYIKALQIARIEEDKFLKPHLKKHLYGFNITQGKLLKKGIMRIVDLEKMEVYYIDKNKQIITPKYIVDIKRLMQID